jgi:hypothetical protein
MWLVNAENTMVAEEESEENAGVAVIVVVIAVVIVAEHPSVSVARLRNDSVAVAIPKTIFEVAEAMAEEATWGVVEGIDPPGRILGVDHQVRVVQVPQEDIEGILRMVEATVGAAALGLAPRGVTDPEVLKEEVVMTNEIGVALMIVVGAQTTTVYGGGAVPIGTWIEVDEMIAAMIAGIVRELAYSFCGKFKCQLKWSLLLMAYPTVVFG